MRQGETGEELKARIVGVMVSPEGRWAGVSSRSKPSFKEATSLKARNANCRDFSGETNTVSIFPTVSPRIECIDLFFEHHVYTCL